MAERSDLSCLFTSCRTVRAVRQSFEALLHQGNSFLTMPSLLDSRLLLKLHIMKQWRQTPLTQERCYSFCQQTNARN